MQDPTSPQIADIRARYRASLSEKAIMIDEHIQMLKGVGSVERSIDDTHEALHKLAGSSGMYGYDDVSALCRSAMLDASAERTNELVTKLQALRDLLEQHA